MIISDEKKFVFVHIPKCAGMSVRAQLSSFDSTEERFNQKIEHPRLGPIHTAHVPLVFLADQFPEIFDKIRNYTPFALLRDPRSRFISAIMQRLIEFKGLAVSEVSHNTVIDAANEAIDWLSSRTDFCDLEYIHFSKQSAYIFLDGEQTVDTLFSIDDMDRFADWIMSTFEIPYETGQRHNVKYFAPGSKVGDLKNMVRPMYRRIVRADLRWRIYQAMTSLGVYSPAAKHYDKILENKDIADFIDSYYADDFALLDKVAANRNDALAKAG